MQNWQPIPTPLRCYLEFPLALSEYSRSIWRHFNKLMQMKFYFFLDVSILTAGIICLQNNEGRSLRLPVLPVMRAVRRGLASGLITLDGHFHNTIITTTRQLETHFHPGLFTDASSVVTTNKCIVLPNCTAKENVTWFWHVRIPSYSEIVETIYQTRPFCWESKFETLTA